MLCFWGSAVCGWWFVVQGTRLAVLCLRARVLGGCCGLLGVCGAWVWCGWASCPGPPFLLGGGWVGGVLSGSGAVRPGVACVVFCWWCAGGCCGGWVGCDLYSGREYLCSLCGAGRAPSWLCGGVVCGAACLWLGLCFVFLGVRWMPWHQGPMKDVVACDIPRGAGWRAVIRGFPNGGTRHELCRVTCI